MTIQVTRKPVAATAIQFDGSNGAAVVQFVKDAGENARNGGNWVSVSTDSSSTRLRKGDWVVVEPSGVTAWSEEGFKAVFKTK
jgi:hypothetical protein